MGRTKEEGERGGGRERERGEGRERGSQSHSVGGIS